MEERLTSVPCVICGKPVRLEECKTNDLGEPVHEACLAERLKEESKRQKPAVAR
jgi:hypothetical protein